MKNAPTLPGKTVVLVDVSGSMNWGNVSAKSDMTRMDAAAALAAIVKSDDKRVFAFDTAVHEVAGYEGLPLVDAIKSHGGGGTRLGSAVDYVNQVGGDRLIVMTDEQSADRVIAPKFEKAYMINVANYKNGVGYRDGWSHIDGFSESIIRYIHAVEGE